MVSLMWGRCIDKSISVDALGILDITVYTHAEGLRFFCCGDFESKLQGKIKESSGKLSGCFSNNDAMGIPLTSRTGWPPRLKSV